jgi:hypothetical protein
MGVKVTGMDEWLRDLETLPERAPKAFSQVVKRGGIQIARDWRARWRAMPHKHIPHLVYKGIDFDDVEQNGSTFSVEVGIDPKNKQAFLADIIEKGTLTSGPHPGGIPALEAEAPKMAEYALKVAVDLLEEGR